MSDKLCDEFAFDTYDREMKRYGGPEGMSLAEAFFFAVVSQFVADILYVLQKRKSEIDPISIAVLTCDDLFSSFGLTEIMRMTFCSDFLIARHESATRFRENKERLRSLLKDPVQSLDQSENRAFVVTLERRRARLQDLGNSLVQLHDGAKLTQPLRAVQRSFLHMHLNRQMGSGSELEQEFLGLLWRTRRSLAGYSG